MNLSLTNTNMQAHDFKFKIFEFIMEIENFILCFLKDQNYDMNYGYFILNL